MTQEITETSAFGLPREGHYHIAMIETCKKKKIKEIWTIYEFGFSTVLDGENYGFVIGLFPGQMEELLRAVDAEEVSKGKFKWETESVIGCNLSFNITHQDIKGTLRAVMSEVKKASPDNNPDNVKKPSDIGWTE